MTARDEIAEVLAYALAPCDYCPGPGRCGDCYDAACCQADDLLASPALANLTREAKAEAWDEGATRVWEPLAVDAYGLDFYLDDNPHRDADDEETP